MLMRNAAYVTQDDSNRRMLEVEAKLIAYRSGWLTIETTRLQELKEELEELLDASNPPASAPARALLN